MIAGGATAPTNEVVGISLIGPLLVSIYLIHVVLSENHIRAYR